MSLEGRAVALIEDDQVMGESLLQRLSLEGCAVTWWRNGQEALDGLQGASPEAVVCDIRLPGLSGENLFRRAAMSEHAPPFLFITAYGEIEQAVRLIRQGAGDYLTKPFGMEEFLDRLAALLPDSGPSDTNALGVSPQMRGIERLIRRMAKMTTPVLFSGETGSGKEVCARFLHSISPVADQPFMAVNCAAIPSELMESELFGHEHGAFTGARMRHLGFAERAKRGVLFMDEIAELSLPLQAKLLRLVEDRTFHRLGGERPIPFQARLICATNKNLSKAVARGHFREDLFYRVNVVGVEVPPLRQRPEDISYLLHGFFREFAEAQDSDLKGLSSLVEEMAIAHDWPGNVRELRNRTERAVALTLGEWLMPGDLFPEYGNPDRQGGEGVAPLAQVREAVERRQIEKALHETDGQIHMAAKLLGISRTTMWEKMRHLQISPDKPLK